MDKSHDDRTPHLDVETHSAETPIELRPIEDDLRQVILAGPSIDRSALEEVRGGASPEGLESPQPRTGRRGYCMTSWTAMAGSWSCGLAVGVAVTLLLVAAGTPSTVEPVAVPTNEPQLAEVQAEPSVALPPLDPVEEARRYAAAWHASMSQGDDTDAERTSPPTPVVMLTTPEAIERFLNEQRQPSAHIAGDDELDYQVRPYDLPQREIIRPVDVHRASSEFFDRPMGVDL